MFFPSFDKDGLSLFYLCVLADESLFLSPSKPSSSRPIGPGGLFFPLNMPDTVHLHKEIIFIHQK